MTGSILGRGRTHQNAFLTQEVNITLIKGTYFFQDV